MKVAVVGGGIGGSMTAGPARRGNSVDPVRKGRLMYYQPLLHQCCTAACATSNTATWGLREALQRALLVDFGMPQLAGR